MAVIGIDDTDSRTDGMCTTYVAARVREELPDTGQVTLCRLNPAVEHKTRGNAALAVETRLGPGRALEVATAVVEDLAVSSAEGTAPGVVVAPADSAASLVEFAKRAVTEQLSLSAASELIDSLDLRSWHAGSGRGRIGALAAIGGTESVEDWTYELLAYRPEERWGTERSVNQTSVQTAADAFYPRVWDTIDRTAGETVCVPNTPGPVLYGIRGDDPMAVQTVADRIETEPESRRLLVRTNQGTDSHLQDGRIESVTDGQAYRVTGTVQSDPETRRGGHVFLTLEDESGDTLECVAFEPTKRFRDRVRKLRVGDRVTVCGEVGEGTLKLEKFAVRSLVETETAVPTCPDCEGQMESAGRDQGYRCRSCVTSAPGLETVRVNRALSTGWYEVPPRARRHIAKPLVRGGFEGPTTAER